MKKYFTPFRIASYLLVLFFLGHTGGGMLAQKSLGPASDAVFEAMKSTTFTFNGSTCTWYGFWFGFGLLASVFLAFSAFAAWQFDRVERAEWPAISTIAWALVAAQGLNAILSFKYFFIGPGVTATLVTILLAVGALRKAS